LVECWDKGYQTRAKKWPIFITTQSLFIELYKPPILRVGDMETIFNKVPNTQTANNISSEQLIKLIKFTNTELTDWTYKP